MSFYRRHVPYLLVGLALIASGCARPIPAQVVPAQAPDSISSALWDSLTAPANLITDAPHLHGTWARNVMIISFKTAATQADRQAAIALIHGEVVGGRAMPMGERQYIVRIPYALPGDSLSGPVLRAFKTLMDHPAVVAAYPLGMTNFNVLHGRGAASSLDSQRNTPTVPAHAPDSISSVLWDSLIAPANIMTDPPGMRGRWARNVMMITFKRTATRAERQAAIELIHGEVVGGNPPFGDDGEYIVRIPYATAPSDSLSGPVLRAFLALRGNPAIVAAYPIGMDRGTTLHQRGTIDRFGSDTVPRSRDRGTGASGQAPDSISKALWDSLTAPANLMIDPPHLPRGPWVKNVMLITFTRTATQAERQAVIALIDGEVVGGNIPPAGERQYIVRIPYALPGDSIEGPVLRAFKTLLDHPAVLTAYPVGMFNPNVLQHRGPASTSDLQRHTRPCRRMHLTRSRASCGTASSPPRTS